MHTKDTINALLAKNDLAVVRGLQTVKTACGFTWGRSFGESLCKQIAEGKALSPRQIAAGRDLLLKNYAAVLARVANDKARQQAKDDGENALAEREAEGRQAPAPVEHGEPHNYPDIDW